MKQQVASSLGVDTLTNRFISKTIPGVGAWGELDVLRGWKDDFLGDSLAPQYTTWVIGAGGSTTLLAAHGGVVRLRVDVALNDFQNLVLGDAADNYTTLDADEGWVMYWRAQIPSLADLQATAGGYLVGGASDHIYAGFRVDVSAANWILRCSDGAGTTNVDTGVAADTNYHWHGLSAYVNGDGNRQADYKLDNTLIGSTTGNVTANLLTPMLLNVNRVGGAKRNFDIDFWAVIPRNLA